MPAGSTLSPEQQKKAEAIAKLMAITGTDPVVNAAMARDPKVKLAKALTEAAGDSSAAPAGGWAWAKGLTNIGSGLLANRVNKRLDAKEAALEEGSAGNYANAAQIAQGLPSTSPVQQPPTQTPAAAVAPAPPPQAMDEVAAAAQAQAQAPAPPPPPVQPPPRSLPPDFANLPPEQATALAQGMTGTPPPNPTPAPVPQGRGAAPLATPVQPSLPLTPQPGSLGGAAAVDSLAGGDRALRVAAGVGRKGLPTGDAIEKMATTLVPGINVTSRARDPGKNKSVGGVGNSFHLPDETGVEHARDFTPPQGVTMAALGRRLKASFGANFDVINEGDHIHVEPSAVAVAALKTGGSAPQTAGAEAVDTMAGGDTGQGGVTDNSGAIPVPDELPPPEKPTRPSERAAYRSARLAMANALINGDSKLPLAWRVAQARKFMEQGLEDQTEANKAVYQTETALDKTEYDKGLGDYYDALGDKRKDVSKARSDFNAHKYRMEEDKLNDDRRAAYEKEKEALTSGTIKSPVFAQKEFYDATNNVRDVDNAVGLINKIPSAVGLKHTVGDIVSQRLDPNGEPVRTAITNLAGLLLHGISGAAVTPEEFQRNRAWLPQVNDTPEAIKVKLANIRRKNIGSIQTIHGMYGNGGMFAYDTSGGGAAAPAAGGLPPGVKVTEIK